MKTIMSLTALALVAACAAPDADAPRSGGGGAAGPDTCNASSFAHLVGKDAVVALQIPEPKRQYRLGDPVTMDHRPDRVNVVLDDTDVIIDIKCG